MMRAIGIMSGTSCDGVDALMLELAGPDRPHRPTLIATAQLAFPRALRAELIQPEALKVPRLAELHHLLPELYAQAVRRLPGWAEVSVCAVHGQTLWHRPRRGRGPLGCTLQLGSTAVLAERLGLPVVGDLRAADVAQGGQGAPIAPFAHWFFLSREAPQTLVVNLGGICNLTYVTAAAADVVAYDVGPAMMLSDAHAEAASKGRLTCDRDGRVSVRGRRLDGLFAAIVGHPFVRRRPPKSTGREDFGRAYLEAQLRAHAPGAAPADVSFTLHAAVAEILRRSAARDGRIGPLRQVLLTGGGAHNPTLRRLIQQAFAAVPVRVEPEGVMAPAHHEPAAMALIGARTLAGLPSSLPQVTGAARASVLGHVVRPRAG